MAVEELVVIEMCGYAVVQVPPELNHCSRIPHDQPPHSAGQLSERLSSGEPIRLFGGCTLADFSVSPVPVEYLV